MAAVEPSADNLGYKMAALQALSTGGSQALAALDKAKADTAASQKAATASAMASAAQYGLGQAGVDALTQPIDRAYNRDSAALGSKINAVKSGLDSLAAPLSAVFDTRYAVQQAKAAKGSGGGGGGGGSKKEPKEDPAYITEYGGLENFGYQLKKTAKGAAYGDNRDAYQQAVAKGVPQYTAARLFDPTQGEAVYKDQQISARKGQPVAQVKAHILEQFGTKGQQNAATVYYTQQYRQLLAEQTKKKGKK